MPPGAGKTRTALLAMKLSGISEKLVCVVPPGIVDDWVAEMKLQGIKGEVIRQTQLHKCWKRVAETAKGIIFDEAHQINQSLRTKVVTGTEKGGKKYAKAANMGLYSGACLSICYCLAAKGTKMLFLTATPAQNGLQEHYWLHSCITGIRNKEAYMRRFYNSFVLSYYHYRAQEKKLTEELPYHFTQYNRFNNTTTVFHTTEEQYKDFKKELDSYRVFKTPQECGLPTFKGKRLKIDELEEGGFSQALGRIKKSDNCVVFYFNTKYGMALKKELTKVGYCDIINGQTKNKLEKIEAFVSEKRKKYLVCQIKAAGVGFSITGTYDVFFIQLGWSPAANYQAASRCRRKSDPKAVGVNFFIQPEDNRHRIVANKSEFFKHVGGV